MSKPKMYGMKTSYIPNAKADMRNRKKVYQNPSEGRRSKHGGPSRNGRFEDGK